MNPAKYTRDLNLCVVSAALDCETALELGCGRGDRLAKLPWCKSRVGVEAFAPLAAETDRRWQGRIAVYCEDATHFLRNHIGPWDLILLIDFIEHLEEAEGSRLLDACKEKCARRIMVFTPDGHSPQDRDVTGWNNPLQVHRSAWTPAMLEDRGFDVVVWDKFHENGCGAIFALWNRP